jgi:hypothetical protein
MSDPVIDEVREVRRRISARVGHDPARLVAYYIELQKQYRGRLIGGPELEDGKASSAVALGPTLGRGGPATRVAEPGL